MLCRRCTCCNAANARIRPASTLIAEIVYLAHRAPLPSVVGNSRKPDLYGNAARGNRGQPRPRTCPYAVIVPDSHAGNHPGSTKGRPKGTVAVGGIRAVLPAAPFAPYTIPMSLEHQSRILMLENQNVVASNGIRLLSRYCT